MAMSYYNAAQYAQRKREGRCVNCNGKMLEEWLPAVRCPECAERQAKEARKYGASDKGKEAKRRYFTKPEVQKREAAWQRKDRENRKVNGLCTDCNERCMEDSQYCPRHREVHRLASNDYSRRRREALKNGTPLQRKEWKWSPPKGGYNKPRKYGPVARVQPVGPTGAPKAWRQILRIAKRSDTICRGDLREALDVLDEHSSLSHILGRLTKKGLLRIVRQSKNERVYAVTEEGRRAA